VAPRHGDVMLNRRRKRQDTADEPLEITHAEMNAAVDSGDAAPLGPGLGWVARYGRGWWVEYEHGWCASLTRLLSGNLTP
jgi:hypothetical protein